MGRSHKKNLRAEKSKIKLKGAKLPKGLNVTKTDFKVQKIVIKCQHKNVAVVNGKMQFDLKETLSRLNHNNMNIRLEALRCIRETFIASNNATPFLDQMNELVKGIVAMFLDDERDARRNSFKTLTILLKVVEPVVIAPFFQMISTYLRCAMTHINTNIQEDSLLLLDVLIEHTPHHLAEHGELIINSFLDMISRVRNEGDGAIRTLTVRIKGNEIMSKWCTKVLYRVERMFAILVDQQNELVNKIKDVNRSEIITYDPEMPTHYSLKHNYTPYTDLPKILSTTVNPETFVDIANTLEQDNSYVLRNYITKLMPLLMETWIEVRPSELANYTKINNQVLLGQNDALSLNIILQILEKLSLLVQHHERKTHNIELSVWWRHQFANIFKNNLISYGFPFQRMPSNDTSRKVKNSKDQIDDGGENCYLHNFSIAYLLCFFFSTPSSDDAISYNSVLKYLNTIVSDLTAHDLPTNCQHQLIKTLRAYLLENTKTLLVLKDTSTPILLHQLLQNTINTFLNNHFPTNDGMGTKLLLLLCEIIQNPSLIKAYANGTEGGSMEMIAFQKYLPRLLLKNNIHETALKAMLNLSKQLNTIFLTALAHEAAAIVSNLQSLQVTGAQNVFEGKKHIMNLFYYARLKCTINITELLQILKECIADKRIVDYFSYVLTCF